MRKLQSLSTGGDRQHAATLRALTAVALLRWSALALAAALAGGCTSEQIYNSAQGWRRNECYKLGDQAQRERCLKEEADRPYDAYRAGATPKS